MYNIYIYMCVLYIYIYIYIYNMYSIRTSLLLNLQSVIFPKLWKGFLCLQAVSKETRHSFDMFRYIMTRCK